MNTIKYSRIKLSVAFMLAGLFAMAGVWVWANFTGKGAFAMGIVALIMPFIMIYLLRYFVDNTIIVLGRDSMKFHSFLGVKRVDYSEIIDIAIETQSYTNVIGGRHLAFRIGDGTFGHPKISEWLLDGKHGKIEGVLETFAQIREGQEKPMAAPVRRSSPVQPASAPAPQVAQPGQRARRFGRKPV